MKLGRQVGFTTKQQVRHFLTQTSNEYMLSINPSQTYITAQPNQQARQQGVGVNGGAGIAKKSKC
jgi:hypothetical protein